MPRGASGPPPACDQHAFHMLTGASCGGGEEGQIQQKPAPHITGRPHTSAMCVGPRAATHGFNSLHPWGAVRAHVLFQDLECSRTCSPAGLHLHLRCSPTWTTWTFQEEAEESRGERDRTERLANHPRTVRGAEERQAEIKINE